MARGDKSSYTDKQKRQASDIEQGYEKRGVGEKEAERRAWATVNKMSGGGKKSGSGRGKTVDKAPARKGGRLGAAAAAARPAAARSASAKKGAKTRARTAGTKRTGAKTAPAKTARTKTTSARTKTAAARAKPATKSTTARTGGAKSRTTARTRAKVS